MVSIVWAPKREAKKLATGWRVRVTPPGATGFSPSTVDLTDDQYERFHKWLMTGGLIQNILPDLTDDQREILMSGIGPKDWDEAFGQEDDA